MTPAHLITGHRLLDLMTAETGCQHPEQQTETDTNGDPCCHDCRTEWEALPDQR